MQKLMPELGNLGIDIHGIPLLPLVDSSDIGPDTWERIAMTIKDNYSLYDGFVVLHGTDTMSYSASALSFMLEGLCKPVIFTGSQLPIGVLRTDAKENLITAVEIAAAHSNGDAMVPKCACFSKTSFSEAIGLRNRIPNISTHLLRSTIPFWPKPAYTSNISPTTSVSPSLTPHSR